MATQYDIFVYLGDRQSSVRTTEIMRQFKKQPSEYPNIYRLLSELLDEGLIAKTGQDYQVRYSKRSQLLYRLITYCIAHGINYNLLLERRLAEFIAKALLKSWFSPGDFTIAPQTFKKYTTILDRYGLLLLFSRKPFRALVPYNLLMANLLQFFGVPVLVKKEDDADLLPHLETELRRFRRLAAKNDSLYHSLVEEHRLQFIHASLSLEGNPVTLPDTVKILKKKIIPKDLRDADVKEIQHYQEAVNVMTNDAAAKKRFTEERILEYHFLTMQHRHEIAGRFRIIPVHIKGNPQFSIAPVNDITSLLVKLLQEYQAFLDEQQTLQATIAFAAYFHNQFQHIHPFEDGNSRTSRLLMFHILQYAGVPTLDIPLGLLDRYQSNTKGYKKRDDRALERTLQYIILYNLKTINARLAL